MTPLFYTHDELLEQQVVLFFDLGDTIEDIVYLEGITKNKTERILERAARIVPKRCLHCRQPIDTHPRCRYCEIFLHTTKEQEQGECGTCNDPHYYKHNIKQ